MDKETQEAYNELYTGLHAILERGISKHHTDLLMHIIEGIADLRIAGAINSITKELSEKIDASNKMDERRKE